MGTANPLTTSPSVATWHTHHKGEKHEAFLAASRRNGWGTEGSTGCGSMSLIKEADGEIRIIPVLCGCWHCPICGPRRAAWLIAQTHGKVDAGELTEFWTLTLVRHISDPSERDVRDANVHLAAAWNRLRTALKAIYPHFVFEWTREHTTARWPHLHLMTNTEIEPAVLSSMWYEATGDSWIVDAQPVKDDAGEVVPNSRIANYLAKYIAAEATSGLRPKGARAFSKSRALTFVPFREKSEQPELWRTVQTPYWELLRKRRARGDVMVEARVQGTPHATLRPAEPAARPTAWEQDQSQLANPHSALSRFFEADTS